MHTAKREVEVLRRILFALDRPSLEEMRSHFEDELKGELPLGCEQDQEALDYLYWLIRRHDL